MQPCWRRRKKKDLATFPTTDFNQILPIQANYLFITFCFISDGRVGEAAAAVGINWFSFFFYSPFQVLTPQSAGKWEGRCGEEIESSRAIKTCGGDHQGNLSGIKLEKLLGHVPNCSKTAFIINKYIGGFSPSPLRSTKSRHKKTTDLCIWSQQTTNTQRVNVAPTATTPPKLLSFSLCCRVKHSTPFFLARFCLWAQEPLRNQAISATPAFPNVKRGKWASAEERTERLQLTSPPGPPLRQAPEEIHRQINEKRWNLEQRNGLLPANLQLVICFHIGGWQLEKET